MLTRHELCARSCVRDLICVVEQIPIRAAARGSLRLDEALAGRLILWTILRWERTFLLRCLEDLGVDMWVLTCAVDSLLEGMQSTAEATEARPPFGADATAAALPPPAAPASHEFFIALDGYIDLWLRRAETQALQLGHSYLGTEHLLLAILANADPTLSAILVEQGVQYRAVRDLIEAALGDRASVIEAECVNTLRPQTPVWISWDTSPAVGVPRRFGLAVMFVLMTMFALLFMVLQLLHATPTWFVMIAVLFAAVSMGQVLLFEGQHPRAASVFVGAVLWPLETLVAGMYHEAIGSAITLEGLVVLTVFSIPLGAFFGYAAGGLTAGIFLAIEWHLKRRQAAAEVANVAAEQQDAADRAATAD